MSQFTFAQQARMALMRGKAAVESKTSDPNFRKYGMAFICASMVFSSLAGKDGHKAEWEQMNNDTSMHVWPFAADKTATNKVDYGSGQYTSDGFRASTSDMSSSPGKSW